jgi:hypothetical protein
MCGGELFVVSSFGLVGCALCLSIVCFGCVELLPLPKGSETCLLQVIFLFSFVCLLISCWSFFLVVSFLFLFSRVTIYVCVVNALIKRWNEDHVWFEDRWLVASWCDV